MVGGGTLATDPEDPVPEDPVPEDPVPEDPVSEDPVPEDPVSAAASGVVESVSLSVVVVENPYVPIARF